eukprot:TRINITY_DN14770_c0_g2_i1.p1 TRINITY_DN14770_c0_g2~~TRINITY_DN14770_c0_g2_i1.p1  ORF type:complete len:611 (+),score=175.25 TRINITY_DN14770_c0_g2_i1:275-2107(+)
MLGLRLPMWPLVFTICALAYGASHNEVGTQGSQEFAPKVPSKQQSQLALLEHQVQEYRSQIRSLNEAAFQSKQELDQVQLQTRSLLRSEQEEQKRADSLQEAVSNHKTTHVEQARARAQADQETVLRKEEELASAKYALANSSTQEEVLRKKLQSAQAHTAEMAHETVLLTDHLAQASKKINEDNKELDRLSSQLLNEANKTGSLAKRIEQAKSEDGGDTGKKTMSVLQQVMSADADESSTLKQKIAAAEQELSQTEAEIKKQKAESVIREQKAKQQLQQERTRSKNSAELADKMMKEMQKNIATMHAASQKKLQQVEMQESSEENGKLQQDKKTVLLEAATSFASLTKSAQASLIAEKRKSASKSRQHQAEKAHLESELKAVQATTAKRVRDMTNEVHTLQQEIAQARDQQSAKVAKVNKRSANYIRHTSSLGKISNQMNAELEDARAKEDAAKQRIKKTEEQSQQALQQYEEQVKRVESLYDLIKKGDEADWGSEEVKAMKETLTDVHARKEHKLAPLMAQLKAAQQLANATRQKAAADAAEKVSSQHRKDSLEELQANFDDLESKPPQLDDKPDPSVQAVLKEFQASSLIQFGSQHRFLRVRRSGDQ